MTGERDEGARDRIARLTQQPGVQQALRWIETNTERFIDELTSLSQIPAPTFAEGPRGEHVARRLQALGLERLRTDSAGNVIGCLSGDAPGPGTALIAHLDTVFGPTVDVRVSRRNGRLYGPGTGDNGAGVAGVLIMLEALQAAGIRLKRPLWVVASVGEEGLGDLRGARAAMDELAADIESVVAVEGALLSRVTHQGVGSRRWRISFRGPGGHSWHDFGRPSAIEAAALAVTAISRLTVPSDPRTTRNVGRIEGGTGVNVIPAEASILVDLRSVSPAALDDLARRAEDAIRHAVRQSGIETQFEAVGDRPAGSIPRTAPLVQTASEVLRSLGIEPRFEAASTDANIALSRGIPAVTLGITHGGGIHTEGEWIEVKPSSLGIRQLLLLSLLLTHSDGGTQSLQMNQGKP